MAVILVDARGENAIVVDSAANARLDPAVIDAAEATIAAARMVVAQLETPTASTRRAFEIARAVGTTLLGRIPLEESTRSAGDAGTPPALDPISPAGAVFHDIARVIETLPAAAEA